MGRLKQNKKKKKKFCVMASQLQKLQGHNYIIYYQICPLQLALNFLIISSFDVIFMC